METRHVQEFAKPPAGESSTALSVRQETEHKTLDQNYHQAAAAGKTVMPPPPPPSRPSPAPAPSHPASHPAGGPAPRAK
jgi:hypothetical protein